MIQWIYFRCGNLSLHCTNEFHILYFTVFEKRNCSHKPRTQDHFFSNEKFLLIIFRVLVVEILPFMGSPWYNFDLRKPTSFISQRPRQDPSISTITGHVTGHSTQEGGEKVKGLTGIITHTYTTHSTNRIK